jgi:hypothetical protein
MALNGSSISRLYCTSASRPFSTRSELAILAFFADLRHLEVENHADDNEEAFEYQCPSAVHFGTCAFIFIRASHQIAAGSIRND